MDEKYGWESVYLKMMNRRCIDNLVWQTVGNKSFLFVRKYFR